MILSLLKKEEPEAHQVHEDLQEILTSLVKYGKPRLSYFTSSGGGWTCTVEMNTNTVGSTFEVRSEFNHKDPIDAVKQCRERIETAIKAITQ